ncbi:NUDIX domain-containing protein [Paenibacillus pini]|nr:NUDIX domain-containing protein [Paenibacillus pini]
MERDYRQYIRKVSRITVLTAILVLNEAGEVLLQQRPGGDIWGLPMGKLNPSESLEEAARRELWEETALTAKDIRLMHMFSGPNFKRVHENGDEEFMVIALYEAKGLHSELAPKAHANGALRFYVTDQLPDFAPLSELLMKEICDILPKL